MMKKTRLVAAVILLCSLLLVGSVMAATNPVITRAVFGSAGEPVTDGSLYKLNGTLGEPIAGPHILETNLGLSSGYWAGGNAGPAKLFLPLVLKNS